MDSKPIQIVSDPAIGATIRTAGQSIPQVLEFLGNECAEFYGANASSEIKRASGTAGGLSSLAAMAFSVGFAHGSGRRHQTASLDAGRLKSTPAPAAKKDEADEFIALYRAAIKSGAKPTEALAKIVRENPKLHAAFVKSGKNLDAKASTSAKTPSAKTADFDRLVRELESSGLSKVAAQREATALCRAGQL